MSRPGPYCRLADVFVGIRQQLVVSAVGVRQLERDDRHARFVVLQPIAIDAAVRLDETLERLESLGDHRIVDGQSVAECPGERQRRHARPDLAGKQSVLALPLGPQELEALGDNRLALSFRAGCLLLCLGTQARRDQQKCNQSKPNRRVIARSHGLVLRQNDCLHVSRATPKQPASRAGIQILGPASTKCQRSPPDDSTCISRMSTKPTARSLQSAHRSAALRATVHHFAVV